MTECLSELCRLFLHAEAPTGSAPSGYFTSAQPLRLRGKGAAQAALTGTCSGLTGGTSPSVAITVTSLGGDAGRVQQATDPRGSGTKIDTDWLGRTLRTLDAFSAFAPSNW
jgi:hypothetical protein